MMGRQGPFHRKVAGRQGFATHSRIGVVVRSADRESESAEALEIPRGEWW